MVGFDIVRWARKQERVAYFADATKIDLEELQTRMANMKMGFVCGVSGSAGSAIKTVDIAVTVRPCRYVSHLPRGNIKFMIIAILLLLLLAAPAGPAAPDVSRETPQLYAQELFAAVGPFHRPPENSPAWVHEVYCETVARELAIRWVRDHPEWMKR